MLECFIKIVVKISMKKHKNLDSHYRIMFYIINNIIETMEIFRQNL